MAQNEQTSEEHSLHARAAVTGGKARVCRGTTARYHSVPTDVMCRRRLAVCDSARSFVVVLSLVTQLTTAAAAAAEY